MLLPILPAALIRAFGVGVENEVKLNDDKRAASGLSQPLLPSSSESCTPPNNSFDPTGLSVSLIARLGVGGDVFRRVNSGVICLAPLLQDL